MIVAIHQPNLLPRLKILQKIALADIWVVLDDVQFVQREYQNRAFIWPTLVGQPPRWCTVPVHLPEGRATPINKVALAEPDSVRHMERSLLASFPASEGLASLVRDFVSGLDPARPLVSLGIQGTLAMLGPRQMPSVVLASTLRRQTLPRTDGIIQLCKEVGATVYVADSGALGYLGTEDLSKEGIRIVWHVWRAPELDLSETALRNGSALNVLLRDPARFEELVDVCSISRTPMRAAA